jgi:hypothetical protein
VIGQGGRPLETTDGQKVDVSTGTPDILAKGLVVRPQDDTTHELLYLLLQAQEETNRLLRILVGESKNGVEGG